MFKFEIISQILLTNKIDALPIALASLTGNLTIFAFAYPYIYKAVEGIGEVSGVLSQRVRDERTVKYYRRFLRGLFLSNFFALTTSFFVKEFPYWLAGIVLILLIAHIFYVMGLYHIISKAFSSPLDYLKFGKNKKYGKNEEQDIKLDIFLLQDLFLFYIRTGLRRAELSKYIQKFIDITIYKFNKFLETMLSSEGVFDVGYFLIKSRISVKGEDLLLPVDRMSYLNIRAADNNNTEFLYYADAFFQSLLEYSAKEKEPAIKKELEKKYPQILEPRVKLSKIEKDQPHYSLDLGYRNIIQLCEYLNSNTLSRYTRAVSYRIQKKVFTDRDIDNIIDILFFVINNADILSPNNVYEQPFSLVCELIDSNYDSRYLTGLLKKIQKNYFLKLNKKYKNVLLFHINILAYILFANKYDLFLYYFYFEEGPERQTNYTRPQIPSRLDTIFNCFAGQNTVFDDTKIFSLNVSSSKYKFFTLFILLINSKNIGDRISEKLKAVPKDNIVYQYEHERLKIFTHPPKDFLNNLFWDEILLSNPLDGYKKYFKEFLQKDELLEKLDFGESHKKFIKDKIDKVNNLISARKEKILKTDIKDLVKEDFSGQLQKQTGAKNIDEYIDGVLFSLVNTALAINPVKSLENTEETPIFLSKIKFNKKQFLFNIIQPSYNIVINRLEKYIFTEIFYRLSEKCVAAGRLADMQAQDFSDYIILTSKRSKQEFAKFFPQENIVLEDKTNTVKELKINNISIKISHLNHYFESADIPPCIMIINKSKFKISKGDNKPVQFSDIKGTDNILVSDETSLLLQIQKDSALGYVFKDK